MFIEHTFPKAETNLGVKGTLIQRFVGGPNIVFLSGPDWKRHRKVGQQENNKILITQLIQIFVLQSPFQKIDCKPSFSTLNAHQSLWPIDAKDVQDYGRI